MLAVYSFFVFFQLPLVQDFCHDGSVELCCQASRRSHEHQGDEKTSGKLLWGGQDAEDEGNL
jgi:hypothetical protein